MSSIDWELFRVQAIKAAGLEGHWFADEAWALAWKYGHEGGKEEILNSLMDIGEALLEDKCTS